jgi:DNA-directed RNA polymerase sigma subunit (sigma70/sigma32)
MGTFSMKLRSHMTFEEIGQREGVTESRAWQIYQRAIKKIRHAHRERQFVRLVILYRARVARPVKLTAD